MKLQQFDGGLHTRVRPQFLNLNEGVVYENIDNSVGTLAPVKQKTAVQAISGRYPYYYEVQDEWLSSDVLRSYVEYRDTLYWSDSSGRPQKYDGTTQSNLGITAPTATPSVLPTTPVQAPKTAELIPGNAGDLPSTTYKYLLVNYDGTYFSAPLELSISLVSNRISVDNYYNDKYYGRATFDEREYEDYLYESINTSSNYTRSVVISKVTGITYGASGVQVYRLYSGKYYLVGTLADAAATLSDTVHDISANAEFDSSAVAPLAGTLQYVYTFYNSAEGIESAPSPLSAEVLTLGQTTLTNLQVSSDAQVDQKRIYRVGGLLSNFALVATIDNATTSYVDGIDDVAINATILSTSNNQPAPTGLKYLTEAYAMLFGAKGTKLYFSRVGLPDYWPTEYFLEFSQTITGIAVTAGGILVFTKYNTFIVTGTGPTSFSQYPLSGDQGCLAHSTIRSVGGTAVWVSADGICLSNGSTVEVMTKTKLGILSLSPVCAELQGEVYYVLNSDSAILAVDFRFNATLKSLSLGVDSLAIGNNKLYGHYDGQLYEMFSSSAVEAFKFVSARFIEGSSTEEKQYKKVYVYSKGDIIINVLIDDQLVSTHTFSEEGSHQIQVPQDKQRGHFIQFEVEGTGEVYEIEYTTARRQNG